MATTISQVKRRSSRGLLRLCASSMNTRTTFRNSSVKVESAPLGQIENGTVASIVAAKAASGATAHGAGTGGRPRLARRTAIAISAIRAAISGRCSGSSRGRVSCGRKNSSAVNAKTPQ